MLKISPKDPAKTCLAITLALAMSACGGGGTSSSTSVTVTPTPTSTATSTPTPTPTATTAQATVVPANFVTAGLASSITTVSCTLSGGTTTTCYRIVSTGTPADHSVGAFCPTNISDGSVAGMWIESGTAYDLTGAFIRDLATFYNDSRWQLYNTTTGKINVTDTQAAFEAAARPNVDPAYNNYCVEGKMSYVNGGVSKTFLIPTTPVALTSGTGSIGNTGVGVALNGIPMDPPAPVAAIKAAYTIAAFDDCGGHINPTEGYHYHAATGCPTTVATTDGHSVLIGYALDGYGVYALADSTGTQATGLDTCRGHTDTTRGYHYHVASAGSNMFIGCFHGQQGSAS